MNKAQEQETPRRLFLLWLRRRHPSVPTSSSATPGHSKLVNRIVAILSLAFLLFWVIGMSIGMVSVHALTSTQLAAHALSEGPTKRHPPSPTPTASATPAPAPSPTFTTTPPTRTTVPVKATPAVTATMSSMAGQAAASPDQTPTATPPTSSTVSTAVPHEEESTALPLTIEIGIATGLLLLAVGLALRIRLMSARKGKLPPSGAAPWQRVRPADPDDSMGSSHSSGQPLAILDADAFSHTTSKSFPSRTIAKSPVPKRQSMVLVGHFSRPTRLKALHPNDLSPVARDRSSTSTRQNSRSIVTIRERAREREKKHNDRKMAQYT